MNRPHGLLLFAVVCAAASVWGEVVPVDVGAWVGREGVTNGWTVGGLAAYSDDAVRFNAKDDFALSPLFPGAVTQLVLSVRSSSATPTRFLTAAPVIPPTGADNLQPTPTEKLTNQALVWPPASGVRQFRLGILTGTGKTGWGLRSLSVFLDDRVPTPLSLREESVHSDALTIAWDAEPRAVSYEIELSRLAFPPPAKVWDFTPLTNATGNTRDFRELNPPAALDDVAGTGLCLQRYEGGYLQIGNTEHGGTLLLPLPSSSNWLARANLFRLASDGDVVAHVSYGDSLGATNALAEVHLATNAATYAFALPADARTLLLASAKGDDRIRVKDVALSPGSVTTNALPLVQTARSRKTIRSLSSGDWLWRVRCCAPDGDRSDWSPSREVRLDPKNPPFGRHGWVLRLK